MTLHILRDLLTVSLFLSDKLTCCRLTLHFQTWLNH